MKQTIYGAISLLLCLIASAIMVFVMFFTSPTGIWLTQTVNEFINGFTSVMAFLCALPFYLIVIALNVVVIGVVTSAITYLLALMCKHVVTRLLVVFVLMPAGFLGVPVWQIMENQTNPPVVVMNLVIMAIDLVIWLMVGASAVTAPLGSRKGKAGKKEVDRRPIRVEVANDGMPIKGEFVDVAKHE